MPCSLLHDAATFTATVNGTSLPAGIYVGETSLTGDASGIVPITLTVVGPTRPTNVLSSSPSTLTFSYSLGASAPPIQILSINSSGKDSSVYHGSR